MCQSYCAPLACSHWQQPRTMRWGIWSCWLSISFGGWVNTLSKQHAIILSRHSNLLWRMRSSFKNAMGQLCQLLSRRATDEQLMNAARTSFWLRNQKNGWKNVCISHEANRDQKLCPLKDAARRFIHIRKNMNDDWDTFFSAFYGENDHHDVTERDISVALKVVATSLNYPKAKGIPIELVDSHWTTEWRRQCTLPGRILRQGDSDVGALAGQDIYGIYQGGVGMLFRWHVQEHEEDLWLHEHYWWSFSEHYKQWSPQITISTSPSRLHYYKQHSGFQFLIGEWQHKYCSTIHGAGAQLGAGDTTQISVHSFSLGSYSFFISYGQQQCRTIFQCSFSQSVTSRETVLWRGGFRVPA